MTLKKLRKHGFVTVAKKDDPATKDLMEFLEDVAYRADKYDFFAVVFLGEDDIRIFGGIGEPSSDSRVERIW